MRVYCPSAHFLYTLYPLVASGAAVQERIVVSFPPVTLRPEILETTFRSSSKTDIYFEDIRSSHLWKFFSCFIESENSEVFCLRIKILDVPAIRTTGCLDFLFLDSNRFLNKRSSVCSILEFELCKVSWFIVYFLKVKVTFLFPTSDLIFLKDLEVQWSRLFLPHLVL